jgi:glyoxylase I family protein
MDIELVPPPATPVPETPPGLPGLHHATITVTDVDRSVAWYSEMLGMVQWMKEEFPGGRAAGLMRPGTQVFLGLASHDGNEGEEFGAHRTGLDHLTFAATDREELRAWHTFLVAKGVECSDLRVYTEPLPFALFTFTDPDGVALEIFHVEG